MQLGGSLSLKLMPACLWRTLTCARLLRAKASCAPKHDASAPPVRLAFGWLCLLMSFVPSLLMSPKLSWRELLLSDGPDDAPVG